MIIKRQAVEPTTVLTGASWTRWFCTILKALQSDKAGYSSRLNPNPDLPT